MRNLNRGLVHGFRASKFLQCNDQSHRYKNMKKNNYNWTKPLLLAAAIYTPASFALDLGDENCDSLLLVSGWFNNEVKIFDGCSGEYIQDLEDNDLVSGPQKITMTPQGKLLVVSENNASLVTWDPANLNEPQVVLNNDNGEFMSTPLAAEFDADGKLYVASYGQNRIVKIDPESWQIEDVLLESGNGLILGIDSGIAIHGDYLYAPGYDSDNVIRIHLQTKEAEVFIPAGNNGMDAPRSILFDGDRMLITSERSDSVMEYNVTTGDYIGQLMPAIRPAGLIQDGDDHVLLTQRRSVLRATLAGQEIETVVTEGEGNIYGATNIFRLYKSGMDSDGDGLSDEDEADIHQTDPDNPDTDADELNDGDEIEHGTDPLNADSDADQMPDGFEVANGLQPLTPDANEDPDNDGLSNLQEYTAGTFPQNPDSDNDGLLDGEDARPLISDVTPVLRGTPDASVLQDQQYQFTPELDYPGNAEAVNFSAENVPLWAEFSEEDGSISGQPGNDDVGVYEGIVIRSQDSNNSDQLGPFSIEVVNVNDLPFLVSGATLPSISVTEGDEISHDLAELFDDIDAGDEISFSAEGLHEDFTLSESGMLSGTAATVGDFDFTVTVTDTAGGSVSGAISVAVSAQSTTSSGNNNVVNDSTRSSGGSFGYMTVLLLMSSVLFRRRYGTVQM